MHICLILLILPLLYWIGRELYIHVNLKSFNNETVLITGGASGIGLLIAKKLAARGSKLILWDLSNESLEKAKKDIIEHCKSLPKKEDNSKDIENRIFTFKVDVTNKETVRDTANLIKKDIGIVSILINNAGVVSGKPLLENPDSCIEKTYSVNTLAHLWTIKSFLPEMKSAGHGHIVTIASASAFSAAPRMVDYASSKAGAFMLDDALRTELTRDGTRGRRGKGVQCTCVCPFFIDTGMFRGTKSRFSWLLPILHPEYVADRVIRGVERSDTLVVIPAMVNLGFVLRILPSEIYEWITRVLGVTNSMDEFQGDRALTEEE